MRRLLLLMAWVIAGAGAPAQEHATVDSLAVLRVEAPSGVVWVDGQEAGPAPRRVSVGPGERHVEVRERGEGLWAPRRRDTLITAIAGVEHALRLPLPTRYRIESVPPGAEVVLEVGARQRVLGAAPLDIERPAPVAGAVVLRKTGYVPQRRQLPGDPGRHVLAVELEPAQAADAVSGVEPWRPEARPNYLVDAGIGAAAVAAAVLAVRFKFEADRLDEAYRRTGDPALRDRIERYDAYALGALGAMQVGVGALALRWVLR